MVVRRLKKFFSNVEKEAPPEREEDISARIQLATCVLLLEVAHSDDHFSEAEKDRIVDILKEDFELSDDYVAELFELAHEERKKSVGLWKFTNVIDNNYSSEEKERVIETLWRVIYADERLDAMEDHLIHRLAKLMNLTHKQLINAKKRVMGWE